MFHRGSVPGAFARSKSIAAGLLLTTAIYPSTALAQEQPGQDGELTAEPPTQTAQAAQPEEPQPSGQTATPTEPDAATTPSSQGAEIVITATRRAGSVFDTPAAVSAMGSEEIELLGISQPEDLVGSVPNLQVSEQTGAALITIRGVGLIVDTGYAEPGVAVYSGGLYQPRTGSSLLRTLDLERIEVLRGPQGTLYGRNATGGVVNFIPAAPTPDFEGMASFGAGTREWFSGKAIASGPLSEGVQVRVAAAADTRDGWIRNLTTGDLEGNQSQYGARGTVRFLPTDNLTIDLIGQFQRANTAPVSVLVTPPNALDLFLLGLAAGEPVQFIVSKDKVYEETDIKNGKLEDWSLAGVVNWDTGPVNVKFVGGYIEGINEFDVPNDALSVPFIQIARDDISKAYSAELNVSGSLSKLDWIVGAYYFKEDYDANLNFRFPILELIPGAPGLVLFSNGVETNKNLGIYADATYRVTDDFRIYAGARYSHDKKKIVQDNLAILGPPPGFATVDACTFGIPVTRSFSDSWNNFSPRVGMQYFFTADVNAYAQFQRGYKAGGWNFTEPCGNAFKPEKVSAWEAGLKSRLNGRRLTLNLTGFYYDYTDLQVFTARTTTAFVVNAPKARVYGAELETRMQVTDRFSIDGSLTAMNARYREFTDFDIVTRVEHDLKGAPLARAPDFSFNVAGQYDAPVNLRIFSSLTARVEAFHTAEIAYRPYAEEDRQNGYWLFDAFAQFSGPDDRYSLRLFARNIGNKKYLTQIFGGGILTGGYRKGTVGLPRMLGAEAIFRF